MILTPPLSVISEEKKMNRRTFNQLVASLAASSFAMPLRADTKVFSSPLLVEARRNSDQEWSTYETRTIARLQGFCPRQRTLNQYGGIPSNKTKKTGFWHLEKIDGRFWMIDPAGGLNIHRAVCSVNIGRGERNAKAFKEKFTSKEAWVKATTALLQENGFNGTGAWTDRVFLTTGADLAFTLNLDIMSKYGSKRGGTYQKDGHIGYPNDCIPVFDPEFPAFCEQYATDTLATYRDNPNFLGYFSDNEMPFGIRTLENYLEIDAPNDPGRLAAEIWLKERNQTKRTLTEDIRHEFLGFVMDKYMSITSRAIRKHDPNHLFLGPRIFGRNRDRMYLIRAIAHYADLISANYYGLWTPEEEHLKGWAEQTGKPFMFTEWYVKGEDSGLANTSGAGWNVRTQKDRGLFYQNYTLAMMESKNCVGWHWFKYQDNDPTAKGVDPSNVDANKGMVDNDFEPYADLVAAMREINMSVFDLIDYFDKSA